MTMIAPIPMLTHSIGIATAYLAPNILAFEMVYLIYVTSSHY